MSYLDGLPKTIRVGPYDYAIRPMRPCNDWGQCDSVNFTIDIAIDQQCSSRAMETVLHELLHAVYHVYGCKPGDDEERTVSHLSIGLTQVMQDSPTLIKWIQKTRTIK